VFDGIWVGRVGRDGLGKGTGVLGSWVIRCWDVGVGGRACFVICGLSGCICFDARGIESCVLSVDLGVSIFQQDGFHDSRCR